MPLYVYNVTCKAVSLMKKEVLFYIVSVNISFRCFFLHGDAT